MTAVGFLYRYGYFTQTLSMDGQQIANYEAQNFNQLPIEQLTEQDGKPMVLEVPYPGRIVYAHIWRVNVGRIKLYLLDTDLDTNSEWDRPITYQLYGGDWENRMKQEYLLGIGGILMLNKLGIKTDLYHCNEGHAALLNVQRLVDYVQNDHLKFNEALEVVRSSSLYTVHTPVPAGHDYFDESLFGKYMGEFPAKLGIEWKDLMNMGRENPDTNENGILDGDEKRLQTFIHKVENEDCAVTEVRVSMEGTGNLQKATTVESIMNKDILCSEVVGLVGEPFEIKTTSQFDKATLTYVIDKSKLGDTEFDNLLFLWYDEENDNFVELDTMLDQENSTVSVETTHFSKYMIVNREEWYKAWSTELYPSYYDYAPSGLSTVLVIDCSGSMQYNDPYEAGRKKAAEKLPFLRS